jgi:hypothetical protein
LKINLLSPWNSWKIAELALNNQQSLTQLYSDEVEDDSGLSYIVMK